MSKVKIFKNIKIIIKQYQIFSLTVVVYVRFKHALKLDYSSHFHPQKISNIIIFYLFIAIAGNKAIIIIMYNNSRFNQEFSVQCQVGASCHILMLTFIVMNKYTYIC